MIFSSDISGILIFVCRVFEKFYIQEINLLAQPRTTNFYQVVRKMTCNKIYFFI
nr:MAG TPA: hypothetical protein [Caudoviricetes sp.]